MSRGNAQNGAIVTDAADHGAIAALAGKAPYALNQRLFCGNQGEFKYSEKKELGGERVAFASRFLRPDTGVHVRLIGGELRTFVTVSPVDSGKNPEVKLAN